MNLNWKRIALLIGFFAAVIVIGYGLYFLFLRPAVPTPPDQTGTEVPGGGGLPTSGAGGQIPVAPGGSGGSLAGSGDVGGTEIPGPPTQPRQPEISPVANGGITQVTSLTTSSAFQPTRASDGQNAIFYDRSTALFYQVSPTGRVSQFSNELFYEVQNVTWAPNRQKAVLEYPDGSNIVYDFNSNEQVTLPNHWKDFSFSNTGDQLVFKSMGNDPENRWLAISSVDGSRAVQIERLGNKDATVYPSWSPNNQIVAMYREEKSFDQQNLYFLGQNNENFPGVTIDGLGFESSWSTQGDKLLYSVYSSATDYKPSLWIMNAQSNNLGQGKKNLQLQTWVDKCTFANNTTVYCAVPTSLQSGAGIYRNSLDNSPTDIYKIDLTSGFSSKIATPEQNVNIGDLVVTGNESLVYFTDKTTGLMYKIDLR